VQQGRADCSNGGGIGGEVGRSDANEQMIDNSHGCGRGWGEAEGEPASGSAETSMLCSS